MDVGFEALQMEFLVSRELVDSQTKLSPILESADLQTKVSSILVLLNIAESKPLDFLERFKERIIDDFEIATLMQNRAP